jgi:hypothetical protein
MPDQPDIPCSGAVLKRAHDAHDWRPQRGVEPVRCPGFQHPEPGEWFPTGVVLAPGTVDDPWPACNDYKQATGQVSDPLAPFRALADQYAVKAAESLRNADASTIAEARAALPGIAAGWAGAEFLLRHTLTDLDNRRTTPDNPPTSAFPDVQGRCPACRGESLFVGSGGYITCARRECPEPDAASTLLERVPDNIAAEAIAARRRALARNAVGAVLNTHGQWLPLTVREAVADAVLAAAEGADDTPAAEAHDRQPIPPEPARAAEDAAAHFILTTICERNGYRPPQPSTPITADDLAEIDRRVEHGSPFGEAVRDVIGLAAWQAQQADAVLDQRINDALNGPTEPTS